ncbi:type IV pilin protein [Acinetobacter schindleri]|uniref:type IV pilin protein n=1 Tax=Acinetobacter schindleri TaxID=108981 RepID=UPI002FE24165
MNQSFYKGFTLIELMVIVVIIAIFAAIAIPSYQQYIARSYQSQAESEMLKISQRLESYKGKQLSFAGYIPENQVTGQEGVINLPYGSSSTDYNYQIILVDINDTSKSLQDSTAGQGWKMIGIPSQMKSNSLRASKSFLMTSRGVNCSTSTLLTIASTSC